jgi:hypothetical protein
MAMQKKKKQQDELPPWPRPTVVIHASVMTEKQEQRLTTAVDALLAEWVRQELGRANKP